MSLEPLPPDRVLAIREDEAFVTADARNRLIKLQKRYNFILYLYIAAIALPLAVLLLTLLLILLGIVTPPQSFLHHFLTLLLGLLPLALIVFLPEYIRETMVIEFYCPFCRKDLNLLAPWTCGNCQHEHNVLQLPFQLFNIAIPNMRLTYKYLRHQNFF